MSRRALSLALLAVAVAALVLPWKASAQSSPSSSPAAETSFADLIARERAAAGLGSYIPAADLADVARAHAQRMAAEGRIYHNPNLREQVQNWDIVGENVGKGGTVGDIHQAFMDSESHRREILSTRLTEVGVGVAQRDGLMWVSQVFRRPTPAPTPAPTSPAPPRTTTSALPDRPGTAARVVRPTTRSTAVPLSTAVPTSAPPAPAPAPEPPEAPPAVAAPPHRPAPPREVPAEVAVATGLLLMAVSGLTSQVGGEAAAQRRRPA